MSVSSADFPILSYPTLALAGQASGATAGTVFTKVLPAGKWLITGAVEVAGANLLSAAVATSVSQCAEIVVDVAAVLTSYRTPVSVVYESNGTSAFEITATCTTSAGTWSAAGSIPISFYKLPSF